MSVKCKEHWSLDSISDTSQAYKDIHIITPSKWSLPDTKFSFWPYKCTYSWRFRFLPVKVSYLLYSRKVHFVLWKAKATDEVSKLQMTVQYNVCPPLLCFHYSPLATQAQMTAMGHKGLWISLEVMLQSFRTAIAAISWRTVVLRLW